LDLFAAKSPKLEVTQSFKLTTHPVLSIKNW
jgi:hypothetical protein